MCGRFRCGNRYSPPSTSPRRCQRGVADFLRVVAATAYGRFCVETGRLPEAEPWLRRAEARAQANGWELATARTQLERAAASWSARDQRDDRTPGLAGLSRHRPIRPGSRRIALLAVSRPDPDGGRAPWKPPTSAGSTPSGTGVNWARPLHIHRILLQRSWIAIFRGRFAEAVELIAQAREWLDSSPRSSWLQYAQLDNHLGTVWRADALTDLGFDAAGDPSETLAGSRGPAGRARSASSRPRSAARNTGARRPNSNRPPSSRCRRRWRSTRCAIRSPTPTPDRVGRLTFRRRSWPAPSPSHGSGRTPS